MERETRMTPERRDQIDESLCKEECLECRTARELLAELEAVEDDNATLRGIVTKLVGALKTVVGFEPFDGLEPRPASEALAETAADREKLGLV